MSTKFGGDEIKRCNKDLGRSLALAWLDDDDLDNWTDEWLTALKLYFPATWKQHALSAPKGLREMLSSPGDFEEAFLTWKLGLLANLSSLQEDYLTATGARLLAGPLADIARSAN